MALKQAQAFFLQVPSSLWRQLRSNGMELNAACICMQVDAHMHLIELLHSTMFAQALLTGEFLTTKRVRLECMGTWAP